MFTFIPYLKTILNCQNLSLAAEKLSISQPALSAALKKAEEQLGSPIFDRTKKPWELTEIGHCYYQYGIAYYNQITEFKNEILDIQNLKHGELRIGGSNLFNTSYLPQAIKIFTEKYPEIKLVLIDGTASEMLDKIVDGEIDLFFSPNFTHNPLITYEKIYTEKILLCIPKSYHINSQFSHLQVSLETILNNSSIDTKDESKIKFLKLLEEYPFILLNESQQIGKMFRTLIERYSLTPSKVIQTDQMATSFALTNAGIGISLISETAIQYGNFKDYPIFYLVDLDICCRDMGVGYHSQRYLSCAAKEFIQIIKNMKNEQGEKNEKNNN